MPKIIRFHELGGADVLQIEDLPLEEPGEGDVRLKVEAIGLNRAEVMFRKGQYLEDPELPSRLGYEAAGIVDAVGPMCNLTVMKKLRRLPTKQSRSLVLFQCNGWLTPMPLPKTVSLRRHRLRLSNYAVYVRN